MQITFTEVIEIEVYEDYGDESFHCVPKMFFEGDVMEVDSISPEQDGSVYIIFIDGTEALVPTGTFMRAIC